MTSTLSAEITVSRGSSEVLRVEQWPQTIGPGEQGVFVFDPAFIDLETDEAFIDTGFVEKKKPAPRVEIELALRRSLRRCSNAGPRPKSSLMNAALEDAGALLHVHVRRHALQASQRRLRDGGAPGTPRSRAARSARPRR